MQKLQLCIDIPNKVISVSRSRETVPLFERPVSLKSRYKIRCDKTITIPADTAVFLPGKIPICNAKSNYEGIIEPCHNLAKTTGIVVTGSMSYSNKNIVPVHCLNVMPYDVTIYKNQLIAFIDPYERLDHVKSVKHMKRSSDFYDSSLDTFYAGS